MTQKRVTIKDIARLARVSPSAVSRALNGVPDVSEETRERVVRIARQLNYQPNALARGLVKRRSNTIGLFYLGRTQVGRPYPFAADVLNGVLDGASAAGYDVVLFSTDGNRGRRAVSYTRLCKERQVEGAILMGLRSDDPGLADLERSDVPLVSIDQVVRGRVTLVSVDNVTAVQQAVEHLIRLGHRRIALINGHRFASVSLDRGLGYQVALQERGMPVDPELVREADFTREGGLRQAQALLALADPPTAIFCASDMMALGAMDAIRQAGMSIPDDVAVVGFDDILLAQDVSPSLTSVRQPAYEMGRVAVDTLVRAVRDETVPAKVLLKAELVVRESSGGPPGRAGSAVPSPARSA